MNLEQRPGADFFRCTQCAGLWFNIGEHIPLEDVAESVDTGSVEQGVEFNKIDRIDCPKCKMPLIRMVDAEQPHIWYESCKNCYGRFYMPANFVIWPVLILAITSSSFQLRQGIELL